VSFGVQTEHKGTCTACKFGFAVYDTTLFFLLNHVIRTMTTALPLKGYFVDISKRTAIVLCHQLMPS
jgi:hypothetical protein